MTAWMLYAVATGTLLAAAAWAWERVATSRGLPARHGWALALGAALVIPAVGGTGVLPQEDTNPSSMAPGLAAAPGAPEPDGPMVSDRAAAMAWLTMSAAGLLWISLVMGAVGRARRSWERDRVDGIDVLVSDRFGPALVGAARPDIVLPRWAMDLEGLAPAIIVHHEDEHRRGLDHLALLYGGLVVALVPWNPAMWWLFSRLRGAVEIDCDRRTLRSGVAVADYGHTLLEVGRRPGRAWALGVGLARPTSLLERRLRTMGTRRARTNRFRLAGLAAMSGGLALLACETPAPTDLQKALDGALRAGSPDAADGRLTAGPLDGITSSGDTVFIFGRPTLHPGTEPLILIDDELVPPRKPGEPLQALLAGIAPESIARVEVVKGEAAGRLLGPRGAKGGAVFIYLKNGMRTGGDGTPRQ